MEYNYDDKRRCEIIGLSYPPKYLGGCQSFERLTLDKLQLLLNEGFIDPEECQNCSPSTMEFKEFLDAYPEATVHGYIVSPTRGDYRVTIEGMEYHGEVSKPMLADFVEMFRYADDLEYSSEYLYCWFD